MSAEIQTLLTQQAKRQGLPVAFLRKEIYPELYQALLIDHIIKTDEIRKHQERLKRKKVFDKLEQKRVEKEKLKADLGSEYVSSEDDSMDFDDIGLEKDELEKILQERKPKDDPEAGEDGKEEIDDSDLQGKSKEKLEDNNGSGSATNSNKDDKGKQKNNLLLIEENEEKEEDNEKDISAEKEKIKNELKQQRENMGFNPLKFLAEKLREIHQQKS